MYNNIVSDVGDLTGIVYQNDLLGQISNRGGYNQQADNTPIAASSRADWVDEQYVRTQHPANAARVERHRSGSTDGVAYRLQSEQFSGVDNGSLIALANRSIGFEAQGGRMLWDGWALSGPGSLNLRTVQGNVKDIRWDETLNSGAGGFREF